MRGMVRRTVYYSGRVQGVGFRYTACHISASFEVVGYVRNLSDGRVQLVAEGECEELDRFFSEVESHLGSHIRDSQISESDATSEFEGFKIC